MKILPILLAGSALAATSGLAAATPPEQSGEAPAATAEAPPMNPAPEADAQVSTDSEAQTGAEAADTAASAATFTDAEIASFAAAALKIQALGNTAAVSQEQLVAIVTESGLEPATYVAINDAMAADPEVAKRVQVAAAALQPGSAG